MNALLAHLSAVPPQIFSVVVPLYLGPDSILPLASVLAAVIGVFLMFGRTIVAFVRQGMNAVLRREPNADTMPPQDDAP